MRNVFFEFARATPNRTSALMYLALTAVLWSAGGVLIKLVSWNPIAIAGTRSFISAGLMLLFIKKPDFKFTWLKFFSACAYSGTVITFVCANKLTTAANAITLQYTAPIYVAIFGAVFLKEKVTGFDIITIFSVFAGMVLFFIDKLTIDGFLGNIVAIISGITFALTVLLLRYQKDDSPLDRVFWGNILTGIVTIPFIFKSVPDVKSCLGIALLGIFQLGCSYILFAIAIKKVSALEAVLIPVIEPVLNPIWVAIFLHEIPTLYSVLGGTVIIISITIRCINSYNISRNLHV